MWYPYPVNDAAYPLELVQKHTLWNGRIVTIRPIRADDAARVRDFLTETSGESRYKRFQKWVHAPSNTLTHFLTDVDYDRRVALVCSVAHGDDEELVGEARYAAPPTGTRCELGIIIKDAWRKTGIAGLLMEALIRAARDRGFEVMDGTVLTTNRAMLRFAQALGFEVERLDDDRATMRIVMNLVPITARCTRPVSKAFIPAPTNANTK
jgi:acetyltransferase